MHSSLLFLLLLQLHLHLLHLLADPLIWRHFACLQDHLDAKGQKESRGQEGGDGFGDQGRDRVAQHGREEGHGDQGGKGGGKDHEPVMSHGHQGSHQECLVANFGKDDHGEGQEE